jgi:ethanolamine ammonia-lyase small subunit
MTELVAVAGGVVRDDWVAWRRFTPARIALGRSGASLPTSEVLALEVAHAQARDAVHRPLDVPALVAAVGPDTLLVASAAPDRATYLRRPDLGRRLADTAVLPHAPCDVVFVLADGLSPAAVEAHAPDLLAHARGLLAADGFTVGPVVVATQARVALGDAVAAALGARAVAVLIGERPGLSSPASLGIYLTWAPVAGRTTDADRNCISNVWAEGQSVAEAARRLAWLLHEARARGATGVALKDGSAPAPLGIEAGDAA